MSKSQASQMIQRVSKFSAAVPVDVMLTFMQDVKDLYKETLENQREVAKLQMQRDVIIEEMRLKYAFWHEVFGQTFAERRLAIEQSFKVINAGLEKDDNELVAHGMQGLATIVSASPIDSALALAKTLESGGRIEI